MVSISQTTTLRTGTVHLKAPYAKKDASTGWIETVDNPSKRLCLLEPADRALNAYTSPMMLDEVKRGLRWGKHYSSTPFFRHPMKQHGCFDSCVDLLKMPLEAFYMIAALIPPRDLLKLSRSTKSLREKLMTRKARWVWRDVIEREGLPDCPEDMSEPSYLSFLYDEQCMGCDIAYPSVDFRQAFMRLRLCDDCAEINIRPKDQMIEELEERCRDTPRDVKLLLDILPGYEATDFYAHSGLVGHDVHDFNSNVEENSLVFQAEVDVLVDAFGAAKSAGVTPFHRFLRGRRAAKEQREKGALLLAQTAQHILKSQLLIEDLRAPPLDVNTPFGPLKARPDRADKPPSHDSYETSSEDEDEDEAVDDEWHLDSDSEEGSDSDASEA